MDIRKFSLKLLIRRFVLVTSLPPFLQIYRAIYALMVFMTVRFFRKYPEIKAVYLRRGSAKGEILPLVSDIDFAVIWEHMNEENKKRLYRAYEKLAQTTTCLDQVLEGYDEDTFYRYYQSNYNFQYRFMEGKETWKLLYGKDYLADLPKLPLENMYGGLYMEIQAWWSIFAGRFFQTRKYNEESVIQNNVCYKTVSEVLKMDLALNRGMLTFSKREALERSKAHLNRKERSLVEKLEAMANKRFHIEDKEVLDETNDFLLCYLDRFYGEFQTHPFASSLKNISQRVDCPKDEWFQSKETCAHIRQLMGYVKEKWSETYRSAYLVPSAHFNMDELILLIEVNPKQLPTVQKLREFNLFHLDAQSQLRSRINLFLLLPNAAFQIDPEDVKRTWHSILYSDLQSQLRSRINLFLLNDQSRRKKIWEFILCQFCNPDLFELLGRPEFAIDGGGFQLQSGPIWTPFVEHFFMQDKTAFYELLDNPLIYKLNNLDFLRIFWKTAQLVIINLSVKKNEIIYPLTLPAVERALAENDLSLPVRLQPLADAYRDELEGESCNIEKLIPEAIAYLRRLRCE